MPSFVKRGRFLCVVLGQVWSWHTKVRLIVLENSQFKPLISRTLLILMINLNISVIKLYKSNATCIWALFFFMQNKAQVNVWIPFCSSGEAVPVMVCDVSCKNRVENRLKRRGCVHRGSDFSPHGHVCSRRLQRSGKHKPVQPVFNRSALPVPFVRLHNVGKTMCGEHVYRILNGMQVQLLQSHLFTSCLIV